MSAQDHIIDLTIDVGIYHMLRALANKQGRSISAVGADLIQEALILQEDQTEKND